MCEPNVAVVSGWPRSHDHVNLSRNAKCSRASCHAVPLLFVYQGRDRPWAFTLRLSAVLLASALYHGAHGTPVYRERSYIGVHLVDVLHRHGHEVTGVDSNLFEGCEWEPFRRADRELLIHALRSVQPWNEDRRNRLAAVPSGRRHCPSEYGRAAIREAIVKQEELPAAHVLRAVEKSETCGVVEQRARVSG